MSHGNSGGYRGKRAFDMFAIVMASPLLAPLAMVIALVVRARDGSPVLYRQERVGRDGQDFHVLKFRTMLPNADRSPFPDASLITPTGRVLRRTSLDELPQLFNVVRGEMSLVGPRPTLRYQVDRYTDEQRGRLAVRPGLTGLAQVCGRNGMPWAQRIEFDLQYVRTASLATDLRILARSALVVLTGRGTEGHPLDDPLAARPDSP